MVKLYEDILEYFRNGVYDQDELFALVYPDSGKHYNTVRQAIHNVKSTHYRVA